MQALSCLGSVLFDDEGKNRVWFNHRKMDLIMFAIAAFPRLVLVVCCFVSAVGIDEWSGENSMLLSACETSFDF